jgi:DNA repair exonuclease SbcCD ATPase subunit
MGLFSEIERLITEHGSAAILRERLALIADQAKAQETQLAECQRRVAQLEQDNAQLKSKLSARARAEEFVEHRGALFKRKVDGTYHHAVYCPVCHKPTGALIEEMVYSCTDNCGWVGTFTPRELQRIISELPK